MRETLATLILLLGGCFGVPIHSNSKQSAPPDDFPDHEWIEIVVDNFTTLRGVWLDNGGPGVLVLYGSGMGISGTSEILRMLYDGGYSVLCCDYRGTGHSSGPWWTSRFLDDDARTLWNWLRERRGERCGVVGISVGAIAAAPLLSGANPPPAVVLDRPVDPNTVIRRFLEANLGPLSGEISSLLVRQTTGVDMAANLAAAKTDALVVLPRTDVLCPRGDADAMLADRAASVEVRIVPGGHLSSHLADPYLWRSSILDFLDARLRTGRGPMGGRRPPPDPARVKSFSLEQRRFQVVFEGTALPESMTLLVMGELGNALIPDAPGRPALIYRFSGYQTRRLGRILGVRVVPEGFVPTIGTRGYAIAPVPAD